MGRRQIAPTICWLLFAILGSVSSVNPNINTFGGNTVKHALGGPPRQPTRVCAQLETDGSLHFYGLPRTDVCQSNGDGLVCTYVYVNVRPIRTRTKDSGAARSAEEDHALSGATSGKDVLIDEEEGKAPGWLLHAACCILRHPV